MKDEDTKHKEIIAAKLTDAYINSGGLLTQQGVLEIYEEFLQILEEQK